MQSVFEFLLTNTANTVLWVAPSVDSDSSFGMKVLLVWGVSRKIPRTKVYLGIAVCVYSISILLAVGL